MKTGNKSNAFFNGEWGKHVRPYLKKRTSALRRLEQKRILKQELKTVN